MIQLRKSKGLLKNDFTKIGGGGYPKLVTKSEIGGNELGGAGGGYMQIVTSQPKNMNKFLFFACFLSAQQ